MKAGFFVKSFFVHAESVLWVLPSVQSNLLALFELITTKLDGTRLLRGIAPL
jgi:hypothetical protein